jgi:DNA-binding IclR family transcriptional regulator
MNENIIGAADAKQNSVSLRTLERGLDVLDCFEQTSAKLSLTEISARIGLNPSTTSRILSTLEMRNYIVRNVETKKYQLGSRIFSLLSTSFDNFDLRAVAAPHLLDLYTMCNETVSLYIVLNDSRVCIERIETTHSLRRVMNIGESLPLAKGAAGRILLAWMPEAELKRLRVYSRLEELKKYKEDGFAVSIGEREEGVAGIAAPIMDANGEVHACITLSGPTVRFSDAFITKMIPEIVKTAEDISLDIGYRKGVQNSEE